MRRSRPIWCQGRFFILSDNFLEELDRRRDFRGDVVFTIDPSSARDLDDALHIKKINREDGTECWEMGVHIADVSYFLQKGTELDEWASKRSTSVYLVHQVIPMLPRVLCEELCSLNPGVDRLTFSVVWHMDNDANILDTEFCRSVICSCAKLSYEHAQDIIDNPKKQFAIAEMPPIHCGRKIRDIKQAVQKTTAVETDDDQLDLPGWVSSSGAEQLQKLRMMSIVSIRLVSIKNSVKYEVKLVPTPDTQSLSWQDAKAHIEG